MFHIQPVATSVMKRGNATSPAVPSAVLASERRLVRPMQVPPVPTAIAMMLPASMTPCAPKVWKAIRPLSTLASEPWKMPTSETPTPARTARIMMVIGRAPLRGSSTRKVPAIRRAP